MSEISFENFIENSSTSAFILKIDVHPILYICEAIQHLHIIFKTVLLQKCMLAIK